MRIIRSPASCDVACKGAVVALGNFDGVHLGHRAILGETLKLAKSLGAPAAVMTFEPHPKEFFTGNREGLRIYTLRQKIALLEECGIHLLYLLRFNASLAATSAEDFVEKLLHEQLRVRHAITGDNFAFGKNRGGSSAFLTSKSKALGFGYTAHPAVSDASGKTISSSAIRNALAAGDIMQASTMLGRPYQIFGRVIHGDRRGRELGFPTANIRLGKRFKPRFGIYAVRMEVGGTWYDGAANLGIRPTFENQLPLLEVHCFNMNQDLYGKQVTVELVKFIRDEQAFETLDALKTQMGQDCVKARNYL